MEPKVKMQAIGAGVLVTFIIALCALIKGTNFLDDMDTLRESTDSLKMDTETLMGTLDEAKSTQSTYESQIESNKNTAAALSLQIEQLKTDAQAQGNDCSAVNGVIKGGPIESHAHSDGTTHYYQLVTAKYHMEGDYTSGITFHEAQLDAVQRCYKDKRGYLATITSQQEQDVVNSIMPTGTTQQPFFEYVAWIGAADTGAEGHWNWINGPEIGTEFYDGTNGVDGVPVGGEYNNWYCDLASNTWPYCEPNGYYGQDCGAIYANQDTAHCGPSGTEVCGTWTDKGCDFRTDWFVVEYGGV